MLTIKILGSGCANCKRLTWLAEQTVNHLGLEAPVVVEDHHDLVGVADHVVVGENGAVRVHDHAGAEAVFAAGFGTVPAVAAAEEEDRLGLAVVVRVRGEIDRALRRAVGRVHDEERRRLEALDRR